MVKRLRKFELPNRSVKVEQTATDTYAMFVAEPFEVRFAHSMGNALPHVLMSSIESAALVDIEIDAVNHEFQSISDVVEDGMEIILNIKRVLFRAEAEENMALSIDVNREGAVLASDITGDCEFTILNPVQVICMLDTRRRFSPNWNCRLGKVIYSVISILGAPILVFCLLMPCLSRSNSRYSVADMLVGEMTDYNKFVLEICTDGRIVPASALNEAFAILKHRLAIFNGVTNEEVEFTNAEKEINEEQNRLRKLLGMSANENKLSVHAANCLNNASTMSVGELASKSESDMLSYGNFSKKSLNEIKES
jgi:DNA-directed RNA polymerase subunit alpha